MRSLQGGGLEGDNPGGGWAGPRVGEVLWSEVPDVTLHPANYLGSWGAQRVWALSPTWVALQVTNGSILRVMLKEFGLRSVGRTDWLKDF